MGYANINIIFDNNKKTYANNMINKKERIKKIFEYLKSIGRIHTQTEFAKVIGSTQATVSNMLSGEDKYITDNLFRKIGYYFGGIFNHEWLETGEGEMLCHQSVNVGASSTVIGNNVNGTGDIRITHNEQDEALELLRGQLAEKDKEIERLHSIIDRLLKI